ncbi:MULTISPECIES: thioesterase family protein [unclassified Carboxylicivirga]|uniref:thioesterase family protein n=1 Tax=Carboxylicivirga TaxID=1628153 RepID=UPI003D3291F8
MKSDCDKKHKGGHPVNYNLSVGSQIEKDIIVQKSDLATSLKTGQVPFISTAAIIVYMEQCCVELIHPSLPIGYDTVSTEMNVRHLHPAQAGETLICRAHLKFLEDKKLFFDVAMLNKKGESIGIGAHERYIVCHKSFVEKHKG